jgi:hypothetical protein
VRNGYVTVGCPCRVLHAGVCLLGYRVLYSSINASISIVKHTQLGLNGGAYAVVRSYTNWVEKGAVGCNDLGSWLDENDFFRSRISNY